MTTEEDYYDFFHSFALNTDGDEKRKKAEKAFTNLLYELELICSEGREFAIVKTKLQEACFYAVKSIGSNPFNRGCV